MSARAEAALELAAGARRGLRVRRAAARAISYAVVIAGALVLLVPFFWMVSSSLKELKDVFAYPPVWLPIPPQWHNYLDAWRAVPFGRYLANTVFVTVLGMFAEITSCTLVAYGFARYSFPGRNALFLILLSTMMLPYHVTLIPTYMIWRNLKLLDTFDPLVLPAWTAWGPFYVFLLRQFFLGVPRDLEEAARIDGANVLKTFAHVMLPQIKPALLAVAVFAFRGYWNNFLGPLIYLNNMNKYTLTLGMYLFMGGVNEAPQWHWLMAMSTVLAVPMLVTFFLAQRYFIEGISLTGLKG
ncbi:MAG: carbohydrate ABC transporter permease [Bacteroidota bacterium]